MKRGTILITGASRGLGAALALAYAGPDIRLILTARSSSSLKTIAERCEDAGATVLTLSLELTDPASILSLIEVIKAENLDLAIANAGVFSGRQPNGQLESISEQRQQVDVNLSGTMHLADALVRSMETKGKGHLALISSLAAFQPQPDSPAYSASKAGLSVWGQAMQDALAHSPVVLSLIYPGHIESDQTAIHMGRLPGLISSSKAAEIIVRGLACKKKRIAFPIGIYLLVRLSNLLPPPLRRLVNAPMRYTVRTTEKTGR